MGAVTSLEDFKIEEGFGVVAGSTMNVNLTVSQ